MTYAMGSALQEAVFQRLEADAVLAALVGTSIYDSAPQGPVPGLYVTLGPEDVRDRSDGTGGAAIHDFTVSVVTDETGFQAAKAAAAAVSDALVDAGLALARGRLVSLSFLKARARRVSKSAQRQIDMTFRARVEDD
ncbi:DUF3168 domain-containing protein [Pseudoruegeria sp. HB172150]|uniref:DUF3168 domain-containing protein n=1 Tax=Pseudoruegeria sp. HB172150 TaxID=2721164 RepID=UPI001554DCCB|nr:DUF3168 domain-containing protein [Pseudoruegeria sp. HB172150]